MSKQTSAVPFLMVSLDPSSPLPLYQQIYNELRQAIVSGRLAAGTQVPATRVLAAELGISRSTVITAFEQLLFEGYLEGRVGLGTYVAHVLPEEALQVPAPLVPPNAAPIKAPRLSQYAQRLRDVMKRKPLEAPLASLRAFRPGLPAIEVFPFDIWLRLAAECFHEHTADLLATADPIGYLPLRETIAAHLRLTRAVRCEPEQVFIAMGALHAEYLAILILLNPGEKLWLEDPGDFQLRSLLQGAGIHAIPVPVDQEGIHVATGITRSPEARMALVTPSHQHPLGFQMSLERRKDLLSWAYREEAWILEYDSGYEYRYRGYPLPSLQSLDNRSQVIYAGDFSQALLPSLPLSYLVVPPQLVEAFTATRILGGWIPPLLEQIILDKFLRAGHFVRHLRRMRALYAQRQQVLLKAACQELNDLLRVDEQDSGIHVIGWLGKKARDEQAVIQRAAEAGISLMPLSAYRFTPTDEPAGIVLGYAGVSETEIWDGVHRLKAILRLK
jgi:GntR family transcriptional regulator/MocR family aminotransferase